MLKITYSQDQKDRLRKMLEVSETAQSDDEFVKSLNKLFAKVLLVPFETSDGGYGIDQIYVYTKLRDVAEIGAELVFVPAVWDTLKQEFLNHKQWRVAAADLVMEVKAALENLHE